MIREYINKVKKSPIFNGFLITTLGSGLSKVILVASTFYCTNMLTKAEFGGFSFVRNTLNMILVICALNYEGLCIKFTAEAKYQERASKRLLLLFVFSLTLCFVAGVSLLLLPKSTMLSILGDASLIGYFRVLGLMLPAFMLQPLLEGVFRGLKEFKLIGYLQVSSSLVFFILIVLGIHLADYDGAVYGMLLYYLLYALISLVYAFRITNVIAFLKTNIKGLRDEFHVLWNMILPVFLLSFIEAPINWWAQVILTKHDSLTAIASMTAILQIRNLTILIPNYFFSTFGAFASTYNAQGNYKEYFRKFERLSMIFLFISIGIFIIFTLFDTFILGLYGEGYKSDTIPFLIANLSIPLMIVGGFIRGNLTIMEHQKVMLMLSIICSLSFISVLYIGLEFGWPSVNAYFWGQFTHFAIAALISFYIFRLDKQRLLKL